MIQLASTIRILLLGLLAMPRLISAASESDAQFEQVGARYVAELPALSPIAATQLGDHRFDHQLDDLSPASRQREREFHEGILKSLGTIDRRQLSRANQVDYALLRNESAYQLWRLKTLRDWEWNPLIYTGAAGSAIYGLISRDFAPLEERLRDGASRVQQLPRFLKQTRDVLNPERVPKIHAETALQQNNGIISLLRDALLPLASALSDEDKAALSDAVETAIRALKAHSDWIENDLIPSAQGDFRVGSALFDAKLKFTLQSPMTREQVWKRAHEEYESIRDQMFTVSQRLYRNRYPHTRFPDNPGPAYRQAIIRAGLEIVYEDIPNPDRIVDIATEQVKEAKRFVVENEIVTPTEDPIEIILMPEFRQGVSMAYCDAPGPLDVGLKTYYVVSPIPESWNDAQVRSFLREYNIWSLQDLSMHEGIPGHFMQLGLANRYPSTLRALLASGPFIEGWAVYSERVMVDAGYQDHDDRMRLINLKWYLRSVTNAIMDQGIHVRGMTRDQAMELMIEGGFQEEREASAKWRRAQLTFAQLSTYLVGALEHFDLRQDVEAAWGDDFNLKRYHDKILSFGSPPVRFVRALTLDEPIPQPN